jgi:hypothetical protein
MDISCEFHYVDEDGNDTVPAMATRITLLVYDEFLKISKRVDWKRDDVNIYDDCSSLLEKNKDGGGSVSEVDVITKESLAEEIIESMNKISRKLHDSMRTYDKDTLNDMK